MPNTRTIVVLTRYLAAVFAIITTLAVFVPLNPGMPRSGLDPSWSFAMNEAVAQNLKIGKDIILTFGPYASIYTRSYHPATDHLMVVGSLFLGLCYAAVLLYLAKDKPPYLLVAFTLLLAVFANVRDALLLSYPVILAACAAKFIPRGDRHERANPGPWKTLAIALLLAPLGLLPLVKGSSLPICGGTTLAIFLYCLYCRYGRLALITLLSPIVSAVIFWSFSGQAILSLPSFLLNMLPMISGYTEAMATEGDAREILGYLLVCAAIMLTLMRSGKTATVEKVFLCICVGLFLLIVFKASFVRHDGGHTSTAVASLVLATLLISFRFADKRMMITLLLSSVIVLLVYVAKSGKRRPIREVSRKISVPYVNAWIGLHSRLADGNWLQGQFERSLAEIRKAHGIPTLPGSTDIYSYDQSFLLASSNRWNPRPVFQSYSVYTRRLAQINEQHLRGDNAPDNILFCVQPIDGRLPSLEDGLSWPALLDNYTVTHLNNNLVYMRKNKTIKTSSTFDTVHEGKHKTGVEVPLPETTAPLFAEIDLKPTVLGKIVGIAFKPSRLRITLKLQDGTICNYRVLSNMMQSGFFVSPLVTNTEDFVRLARAEEDFITHNKVASIAMRSPSSGRLASLCGKVFWDPTYTLTLKCYRGEERNAAQLSP